MGGHLFPCQARGMMIPIGLMKALSCLCLLVLLGVDSCRLGGGAIPVERKLSAVSAADSYHLPVVSDAESNKRVYETLSVQAEYSAGTLTVTIKNTGKKDAVLLPAGVHIRLCRTPFSVRQGKKEVSLSLPKKAEIAAGGEWQASCSAKDIGRGFVHVGFVSLVLVGERVYEVLPERDVPIQRDSAAR